MTTLPGRTRTALMIIDFQNNVVADAYHRDDVAANIAILVDRARHTNTPIVWIQHHDAQMPRDTDGWQYVPELTIDPSEPLVHKAYGDAFEETKLEDVLAEAGIGHLIVTGASTDVCVRATIHTAFARGYDVTLVGDAHTTDDLTRWGAPPPNQVIAHTNLYWDDHAAPGRTAAVVNTADVTLTD